MNSPEATTTTEPTSMKMVGTSPKKKNPMMIEKISDEYFNSRPEMSRISAIASPQSQVIESRQWLEDQVAKITQSKSIARPHHWGGYVVRPITIEFWQGRANRLHDRIQYTLEENGGWKMERLAP